MSRWAWIVLCSAVWLAASPRWTIGHEPPKSCQPQLVKKTILVPGISYRMAEIPVIALQPKVNQKTVTVVRDVPQERTVKRQVPVLVPEEQTVTETFTECRQVEEEVSREVVVWQPHAEVQEGTRTTSRPVLAEEKRTILKDIGGWMLKERVDCFGCRRVCRVWVPRIVSEEITLSLPRLETVETPFREEVVTYKPETKTITEHVCRPVLEEKTREVTRTVCVEKLVEREFTEVTWRRETEEQTVNYLVPEALTEQRELPVATRALVPQIVECPPQRAACRPQCR